MKRASAHQSVPGNGVSCGLPAARPMQSRGYFGSGRHDLATLPRLTVARRFRGTCQRKSPARFMDSGIRPSGARLGVSSRLAACPFDGVGGSFRGISGSLACQGVEPSQISPAAFLPSSHVALPGARCRLSGAI